MVFDGDAIDGDDREMVNVLRILILQGNGVSVDLVLHTFLVVVIVRVERSFKVSTSHLCPINGRSQGGVGQHGVSDRDRLDALIQSQNRRHGDNEGATIAVWRSE